MKEKYVERLY